MSHDRTDPTAHERYRDDLAAYALGALEEREAAELERHRADCEACRLQLRWLEPAVDLLPRSTEQLEPPAGLRERLMATVRAEAPDPGSGGVEAAAPRRRREWVTLIRRPATAVAAVALLVLGAAGGYLLHDPGESSSVIAAQPSPAAPPALAGTLEREDGSAILTMSRLPALPRDDVYEIWVKRDGSLEPSSLFVPRRDGAAEAAVPGSLDGADAVLVTREPRGGSLKPTSRPLLRADLN